MDATKNDFLKVRVSRLNESANKDPYVTLTAYEVSVSPDGRLSILGRAGDRGFSAGTWDEFEVTRFAIPK